MISLCTHVYNKTNSFELHTSSSMILVKNSPHSDICQGFFWIIILIMVMIIIIIRISNTDASNIITIRYCNESLASGRNSFVVCHLLSHFYWQQPFHLATSLINFITKVLNNKNKEKRKKTCFITNVDFLRY
uniref:Uncharacterized protein n=1 Tax=Octopus bimaculoides TaxID=37653 RepID=A0A0L8IGW8_OCTBM